MSAAGDVRGFYAALGIELPGWAQHNATVRCFTDPDAHAHQDRSPSCSVSLEHGAWRCWGCGAKGSAYQVALERGYTPASAFDLLVIHGLAQHDASSAATPQRPKHLRSHAHAGERAHARPALAATDADVNAWHHALFSAERASWRSALCRQRLWSPIVMDDLELGHDGERITIPIRNAAGQLRGVLRYRPGALTHKMLAIPGTRLGLIPHPAREPSQRILLVEGPPDMIAARSYGWPAIAVPGDHAWRPDWAQLLAGRTVTVITDSDPAGRDAAHHIAEHVREVGHVRVVDLAPSRDDGFDLTDWLLQHPQQRRATWTASSSSKPTITP